MSAVLTRANVVPISDARQRRYEIAFACQLVIRQVKSELAEHTEEVINRACDIAATVVTKHWGKDHDPIELGVQAAVLFAENKK